MLESVGAVGYVIRKLNQVRENVPSSQSRFEAIEIIEAVILALVAVATAWSGYQAARWAGMRAENYAEASRLRVTAEGFATLAGQERIYDSDTFNSWLAAKLDGKAEAAEFFERRFRDEYRPAFTAWLSTDPFNNAQAPPGPIFMPDYHNAKHEQFLGLNKKSAEVAEQGTKSGETGDQYVRITVLLATVLLITAIGQRFHFRAVRVVFMILSCRRNCSTVSERSTFRHSAVAAVRDIPECAALHFCRRDISARTSLRYSPVGQRVVRPKSNCSARCARVKMSVRWL